MKWLWAAYRRGVFSHLPEYPEGLDTFQFQTAMLGAISNILQTGGDAWIVTAKTLKTEMPVGLAILAVNGKHAEPHVFWFPEASARNKLECSVKWLTEMKQKYKLDLYIREPDWHFFDHLCKYGLLRTVGKYRNFFDNGEDAMLFQSVS